MPSGAKKRKAAARKKKSSQSHQGESNNNNGGRISPTSQYPSVEKIEDNSSKNKSKDINEKPKSSNRTSSSSSGSSDDESSIIDKNVVVLESVPETISPIVEPVKPVDSLLDQVSQVFDEIQNEKKKDLVVVSETVEKDDCLTSSVVVEPVCKENEVEKVASVGEEGCLVLKDDAAYSTGIKDGSSETDTVGDYNKQAPVASSAVTVQRTTTWKSCCGLFELFSGSERN